MHLHFFNKITAACPPVNCCMNPLICLVFCCIFCGVHTSNFLDLTVPSSSSSSWRESNTLVGDDQDQQTLIDDTVTVNKGRSPVDCLLSQDPRYLEYLRTKRSPNKATASSSITRKLARPDFMEQVSQAQLEKWLTLRDTSIWDATKIIESPNFDGTKFSALNSLPLVYLKRRLIVPFIAFLRRFKYLPENELQSDDSTTPFTNLVLSFLEPGYLTDPTVDSFFKVLVETQFQAFETDEWRFFDTWLSAGSDAWRFLKIYFEAGPSKSKSESLTSVLTASDYTGPITPELIKYILSFKDFNINVQIPYTIVPGQVSAFFHIVALDSRFSQAFLSHVLKDPRLDVDVPTGKIIVNFDPAGSIVYENKPIVFLAAAIGNIRAFLDLMDCERIIVSNRDFVIFVFWHIFTLIWLVIKSKYDQKFGK